MLEQLLKAKNLGERERIAHFPNNDDYDDEYRLHFQCLGVNYDMTLNLLVHGRLVSSPYIPLNIYTRLEGNTSLIQFSLSLSLNSLALDIFIIHQKINVV